MKQDRNIEGTTLRLSDRLALRPKEAAQVLGLSEGALRALLPELPVVRAGRAVLLPVDLLREWLRSRVEASENAAQKVVREAWLISTKRAESGLTNQSRLS